MARCVQGVAKPDPRAGSFQVTLAGPRPRAFHGHVCGEQHGFLRPPPRLMSPRGSSPQSCKLIKD